MSHIVFVSLFLGLVSGVQPVDLRVDQEVKSVTVTVSGRVVATMTQAPWRTLADLGPTLDPRELAAIAYDDRGNEIGRATQILNLPRPIAEVEILLHNERGVPGSLELVGTHRQFLTPRDAAARVDGKKLKMRGLKATLPTLDWTRSHVISAEVRYPDGSVARSEMVLAGGFADAVGTQLSPVIVSSEGTNCFAARGITLHASAIEKTNALVLFVRDPDPRPAQKVFDIMQRAGTTPVRQMMIRDTTLDPETTERIIWPIAQQFSDSASSVSTLFEHSNDFDWNEGNVMWMLSIKERPYPADKTPRRFADAVAVAGIQTMAPARRRAVVLVLSDTPDQSLHSPAAVRQYLDAIDVPLFVWSLEGPRPDLAGRWGAVEDVSHPDGLRAAVDKLRRTIAAQSVAWIPTDPLTALRAEPRPNCAPAK